MEAQVGAGGLEAFVQGAVVGGELAETLLECGVLGGDVLDRVLGPFGFQVAVRPSSSPIRVRWVMISWFAVLSACSALSARSRQLASPASSCSSAAVSLGGGLPDGFDNSGFRVSVGVEEGSGHVGATCDRGHGDRCFAAGAE